MIHFHIIAKQNIKKTNTELFWFLHQSMVITTIVGLVFTTIITDQIWRAITSSSHHKVSALLFYAEPGHAKNGS